MRKSTKVKRYFSSHLLKSFPINLRRFQSQFVSVICCPWLSCGQMGGLTGGHLWEQLNISHRVSSLESNNLERSKDPDTDDGNHSK